MGLIQIVILGEIILMAILYSQYSAQVVHICDVAMYACFIVEFQLEACVHLCLWEFCKQNAIKLFN